MPLLAPHHLESAELSRVALRCDEQEERKSSAPSSVAASTARVYTEQPAAWPLPPISSAATTRCSLGHRRVVAKRSHVALHATGAAPAGRLMFQQRRASRRLLATLLVIDILAPLNLSTLPKDLGQSTAGLAICPADSARHWQFQ